MVREEIVLRPARGAAAFCAIVILGLGVATAVDNADQNAAQGFEIRAEILH